PELLALLLPTLRADFRAADAYAPSGHDLRSQVVVITGDDDEMAAPETAAGWRDYCSGPWEHVRVPGDHFYPFSSPAPTDDVLRRVLARAGTQQLEGAVSP
ncbi:MAG: thioesterase domain-containing protein, partial [Mycobacteriales bacterium]